MSYDNSIIAAGSNDNFVYIYRYQSNQFILNQAIDTGADVTIV